MDIPRVLFSPFRSCIKTSTESDWSNILRKTYITLITLFCISFTIIMSIIFIFEDSLYVKIVKVCLTLKEP